MLKASDVPAVVVPTTKVPRPVRHDREDPAPAQALTQRVAVVPPIPDKPHGILTGPPTASTRDANGLQGRVDQRDFRETGRGDMNSQRNTLAVDHHHPLRTLAAAGFSDV